MKTKLKKLNLCAIASLSLSVGCNAPEPPKVIKNQTFTGRYLPEIYHAEVPIHWIKIESEKDLTDTKLPIASYKIGTGLLTIHNFPYAELDDRIAPEAQVKRWQNQFPNKLYDIETVAHGGFGGLRMETDEMIGYAMQLTPVLFRALGADEIDRKGDYTIKFVGNADENREDVNHFAKSFEWTYPLAFEKL